MDSRGSARDADIGLDGFLTTTPGLGGRLKVRVDDFRVDEVGGLPPEDPAGPFTCAVVRLTNWETNKFVQTASERLAMSRKRIHFSGTKDKRGVTSQVFTFEADATGVEALGRLPGVAMERVYRCASETQLGRHVSNRFEITVRDLAGDAAAVRATIAATWQAAILAGGFPNVFGPQRFGSVRATTHRVGERIIRGDFRGAVHAYLGASPPGLAADAASEWERAAQAEDFAALLRLAQGDHGFERTLLHRLIERPGDHLHALLGFPKNLQLLFVYAYQSFLFNQIVWARIRAGIPAGRAVEGDLVAAVQQGEMEDHWVPVSATNVARVNEEIRGGRAVVTGLLPGSEVPHAQGAPGRIEADVLARAGVTRSDFIVPEHLEWCSKGSRRALTVRPAGFESDVAADELHPGRLRADFSFELPRGAYATTVLREFLKSDRLRDYA